MNEAVQTEELEQEVETTEESTEIDSGQEIEDSGASETEKVEEEHKPSRTQNAKQRLRRKWQQAEAEKAELLERTKAQDERLASLEEKLQGVINPPAPRPSRVDFETEEEYEDSLFEWRDSQKSQPAQSEQQQTSTPETQKPLEVAPEVQENWSNQIDEVSEKYDDFEDALFSIPKESMTEAMTLAIMESDSAGEIAYFLGTNHEEAARIANMSIVRQVKEIDKLGSKFTPKTTNAPDPVTPVKGDDSPMKDISKMSPEEYRDYRRAQMAKRR